MSANPFRYWALLDFLATGQYRYVGLGQDNEAWTAPAEPGMAAAMEHMLTAMIANQQPDPATLGIRGLSLTMPVLRLALQCPSMLLLQRPSVSLHHSPPPQQQPLVVVPSNDTADRDDHAAAAAAAAAALRNSPERGTNLSPCSNNDGFEMLQAATTLQTNVARLDLCFPHRPIVGRLDFSILTGFLTSQPNSVDLSLAFGVYAVDRIDADATVEHILADVLTQCPDVHGLFIRLGHAPPPPPLFFHERFARLTELVSNTALKRFVVNPPTVLSPEQNEQISVITQRNGAIPAYLGTTGLLKQRRPPTENDPIDPPIMVMNEDEDFVDLSEHKFVLSHALSQAAVHPVFFSHFYQYVRDHADQLPGGEGRQAPAAAAAPPPPPP
jgi:hypothetical protein